MKEGARILELHQRGREWVDRAKQWAEAAQKQEVRAWRAESELARVRREAIALGVCAMLGAAAAVLTALGVVA